MRIFIHGSDRGNAMITAMTLVIVLSTLFISFVPRITAVRNLSREYKSRILLDIEQENNELRNRYELY